MRKAIVSIAAITVVCAGCFCAYLLLSSVTGSKSIETGTTATNIVRTMKTGASSLASNATNAAIDASGLKTKVNDYLESHTAAIAQSTGASQTQINQAVADLNIESWTATTLPSTAVAESTQSFTAADTDVSVTSYTDPSYVTVSALGQNVTLSVPESAQSSLALLGVTS